MANPQASNTKLKYRVCGSVRDDMWKRKDKMVIQVFEKTLIWESELLASSLNLSNGFFDIPYSTHNDPKSGKVKSSVFNLGGAWR